MADMNLFDVDVTVQRRRDSNSPRELAETYYWKRGSSSYSPASR
jgi:hypothetical protein